jgi:hypothetical protein
MSSDNPRTLRAEVESLFDRAMDTGEIIAELERRGRRFERRSVIVMCSQLRLRGGFSQTVLTPGAPAPMYLPVEQDRRKILDLIGQERGMKAHDVALHLINWIIDEDFAGACPTLPPAGGV